MNTKKLVWLLGMLGVAIVVFVAALTMQQSNLAPTPDSSTAIINPKSSPFEIEMDDSYAITSGADIKIPIDVKGATATGSQSITGFGLKLTNVPSSVKSASLALNGKTWTVNKNQPTSDSYTFSANNPADPITGNLNDFLVLTLNIGTAATADFTLSVELDDSATPSIPHKMSDIKVHLTSGGSTGTSPVTLNISSSVTVSGSSFVLPIGLSGLSSSLQVDGISLKIHKIPSFLSNCTATTSRSGWSVMGNMTSASEMLVTGTGAGNPVSADIAELLRITCTVSGTPVASAMTIEGEVSTVSPKTTYSLSTQTINLILPTTTPTAAGTFSISGTISGDTKSGVTVKCNTLSAKSASNGTFTIANVPDKTTCTLIPQKNNYIFSPASRQVTIQAANVTAQDFRSDNVKGDEGDRGKTGKSGKTVTVRDTNASSGGGTQVSSRVAPKSGPAENIIIVSAVLIGLIGAVVFAGSKLKWFS